MKIETRWWIRNSRPELAFACQTLLLVLLAPWAVRAQQDTIPQRGFFAAGSYALSDLETINTANGNVMFRIPLVSLPPGRAGTNSCKARTADGVTLLTTSCALTTVWTISPTRLSIVRIPAPITSTSWR